MLDFFCELMDKSRMSRSAVTLCPQAIAASKCVYIVSQTRAGRKLLEKSDIASPEHNIVNLHCGLKSLYDLFHLVKPFFFPCRFNPVSPT